jgi:hypothetical protein
MFVESTGTVPTDSFFPEKAKQKRKKFVHEIGTEFVPRILYSNIGMDPIDMLAIQRTLNIAFWSL